MAWSDLERNQFLGTLVEFWPTALKGKESGELGKLWAHEFERWPVAQATEALRRVKSEEEFPRTPTFFAVRQALANIAGPVARGSASGCQVCLGEGGVWVQVWIVPPSYALGTGSEDFRDLAAGNTLVRPERAKSWSPPPQDALYWPGSLWLQCDHCGRGGQTYQAREFTKRFHGFWGLTGGGIHHRCELLERILSGDRTPVERFGWKEFKRRVREGKVEVDGRDLELLERVLGSVPLDGVHADGR